MYYYIETRTKKGDPWCLGPYSNERKAQDVADKLDNPNFEIVPLRTSNLNEATRVLKARRISSTGLEEGTKRFSHKQGG